jgi:hypothetical protein
LNSSRKGAEARRCEVTARKHGGLTAVSERKKEVGGVPLKFDPIVMRGFVGVSGWFRCLAERRP